MGIFLRLSIKQRILAGFGFLQLILVVVSISVLLNLSETQTNVTAISQDI